MSETNPDHDPVVDRLHELGRQPVPGPDAADHLARMAATPAASPRRFGRVAVAAATVVGFLAGSTGFAMAGALPDGAQDVAHDVLAVVQVDVPEGRRGECVSAIARSEMTKAEKKAAKAACPKGGPSGAGEDPDAGGEGVGGGDPHPDDPCRGRPPWAGPSDLTKAEKDALKAERAAVCPDDDPEPPETEAPDTSEPEETEPETPEPETPEPEETQDTGGG